MRQVLPYPKYDVVQEITEEWVEHFSNVDNQNGFMWVMTAQGFLPEGVDPNDERVSVLCKLANDYYQERRRKNGEETTKDSATNEQN